jgi:hypothetical protein
VEKPLKYAHLSPGRTDLILLGSLRFIRVKPIEKGTESHRFKLPLADRASGEVLIVRDTTSPWKMLGSNFSAKKEARHGFL